MPTPHIPHIEPEPFDASSPAIVISGRLAKALAHPLRVQILSELNKKEAISPKEFRDTSATPAPISTIAKHFRALEGLRCIEIAGTRKSGRTIERLFRATRSPAFARQAWEALPRARKLGVSARIFASYLDRVEHAVEAGTFDSRSDRRMSWQHHILDEISWVKLIDATEAVLWWSLDMRLDARQRLAESSEPAIPLISCLSAIEGPPRTDRSEALAQLQYAPFFLEKGRDLYFKTSPPASPTISGSASMPP